MDRSHRRTASSALARDEHLQFGDMETDSGTAAAAPEVLAVMLQIGGRLVFEDPLARPAQGVRYWSRSQPLPRSRSFQ